MTPGIRHLILDIGALSYWKLHAIASNKEIAASGLTKEMLLRLESERGFKGWIYDMKMEILNLIDKHDPDLVTLACDGANLWRKDIYPEYKENRKAQRAEMPIDWALFHKVRDEFVHGIAKVLPIKTVLIPKIEADDIIAILTEKLHETQEIIAITHDKDCTQLFKYPNYRQIRPFAHKIGVPLEFKDVDPVRVLQLKIICGDDGDNIKNLRKGIGEKKALKIIEEYNGNIYNFALKENLLEAFELNQRLINFDRMPDHIKNCIWESYVGIKTSKIDHFALSDYFGADYDIITSLTFKRLLSDRNVKNLGWN